LEGNSAEIEEEYENPEGCCKNNYDQWGWVECCGGKAVICLGKKGEGTFPDVKQCLVKDHEQQHLDDLPPGECGCKPEGFWLMSDWERDRLKDSECAAFAREFECLMRIDCSIYTGREKARCLTKKRERRTLVCQRLDTLKCPKRCHSTKLVPR
jgi:hypothetical protein